MKNRSANATIKGYFYQFDHSIIQLLSAVNRDTEVLIEGIEDIDLTDGDDGVLIQCKYYEGTEYNHSVIKDAIIQMLRHFFRNGCDCAQKLKYRVYGHYKEGQDKLPGTVDLDFLKTHFLTYSKDKENHQVHVELEIDDARLNRFLELLEIDVRANTYDDQQRKVEDLFASQIGGCTTQDIQIFYYPIAIHTIQKLAVQKNENDRKITKAHFLENVDKKEVIFSSWLKQKFGSDYYERSIKKRYFSSLSTKVSKAARIFIIEVTGDFKVVDTAALLVRIATKYSHVEHKRTPAQDRFCPYVLLWGASPKDLIQLKGHLLNSGTKLVDGYPFLGAEFSPKDLVIQPTKENLIKLRFIPSADQVEPVVSSIAGMVIEIYEFYKNDPIAGIKLISRVPHHKIKTDNLHFIMEVI